MGRAWRRPVVKAFFAALAHAAWDLLEEVLAAPQTDHARLAQHDPDHVLRAAYDVRLAQHHYQAVAPEHRVVAAA